MREVVAAWRKRGTCPRLQTACAATTPEGIPLIVGYNGAVDGEPHCVDVGCLMEDSHCVRAVHDVQNAVAQAAVEGICLDGANWWLSHSACALCAKLLVRVRAHRVYVIEPYRGDAAYRFARDLLSRRCRLLEAGELVVPLGR